MLLEMAVGDSYAIAWEFCPSEGDERPNDLRTYWRNPKYPDLGGGRYTDDTQRAIANAEVLLTGSDSTSVFSYAEAYAVVFRRDPRPGYGSGYYEFLKTLTADWTTDREAARRFVRDLGHRSARNGAVMGVAPLGYLPTINEVRLAAKVQALTTHTGDALDAAAAVALMAHYFIYNLGPKEELPDFLDNHDRRGPMWYDVQEKGPRECGSLAQEAAEAVLSVIMDHDNLADMLRAAVDRGGIL